MVHLEEPVHSDKYLAEKLVKVTNDFGITSSIFTITRDNATNNDSMLNSFEGATDGIKYTALQPWGFSRKYGDVRCMAHILNLAVQDALKSLKAIPEDTDIYRVEEERAEPVNAEEDQSLSPAA